MTTHPELPDTALTPSGVGAPELNEIEITPAMIEAGLSPLFRFDRERGSDEDTLKEIFRAMSAARKSSFE